VDLYSTLSWSQL